MHKKNIKKAFTLAEALLTMVLLGIIAAFTITQIKPDNYGHQSMQALGKKMMANLAQATTQMLVHNARLDDLLLLKNKTDYFSITDANVAIIFFPNACIDWCPHRSIQHAQLHRGTLRGIHRAPLPHL